MKRLLQYASLSCTVYLGSVFALGEGGPKIQLTSLVGKSDVIVVGTLAGMTDPIGHTRLVVAPVRVLKGSVSASTNIVVERQSINQVCPDVGPAKPVTGVWFLKSTPDASYALLRESSASPCFPELTLFEVPDSPNDPSTGDLHPSSTVDEVALELAEEVWQTNGDAPRAFVEDNFFLHGASLSTQFGIYKKWETSKADRVRMLGLVGLISIGDVEAILSLANGRQDYRQIALPIQGRRNGEPYQIHMSILGFDTYEGAVAQALGTVRSPSSQTIRALGTVARAADLSVEIRRSAAQPLRLAHTLEAATELAPLLNSEEAPLRAEALVGISQYADALTQSATPSPLVGQSAVVTINSAANATSDLRKHFLVGPAQLDSETEGEYLQFWSEWSKAHLPAH
jgi:hypothetical protein